MAEIEWCRKYHYPILIELDQQASIRPWSIGEWKTYFAPEYDFIWVKVEEKPVGFAVIHKIIDEWHIANIGISPEMQRQGLGFTLLSFIADEARDEQIIQIHLEVRKHNISAQKLYEKGGYKAIGLRKKYYRDPLDDAILYLLQLQ